MINNFSDLYLASNLTFDISNFHIEFFYLFLKYIFSLFFCSFKLSIYFLYPSIFPFKYSFLACNSFLLFILLFSIFIFNSLFSFSFCSNYIFNIFISSYNFCFGSSDICSILASPFPSFVLSSFNSL